MTSLLPEGENSLFLEFSHRTWTLSSTDLKLSSGEVVVVGKGKNYPYDPDMDVNDEEDNNNDNDDDDDDPTVGETTGEKGTVLLPRRRKLPSSFPSTFLGGTNAPDHGPSTDTTLKAVGGGRRSSSTNSCSDVHTVVTESSNTVPSFSFEIDLPTPVDISPLSWKESTFQQDRRNKKDGQQNNEKLPIPPLEVIHRTGRDEPPSKDRTRNERSVRAPSKRLVARPKDDDRKLLTRSQSLLEDPDSTRHSSSRGDRSPKRRIRSRSDGRTAPEDPTIPVTTTKTTKTKATTRSSKSRPQGHSGLETGTRSDGRRKARNGRARSLSSERGEIKGGKVMEGKSPSSRRAHTERNRGKSDEMLRSMSPSKSYRKSTNYGDGRSLAQYRAHSMSGAISRRSTRDIYNMEPSTSTRSKSSTRFRKSDASDRMLRTSGMSNNGRSRTSVSPVKSQRSVRAITTPSTHRRQLSSSNLQGQPSVRATRPLDSRHSLRSRRFVTSMMNVKAETNKNNPGEGPFHVLKSENIAPNVEPQDSSVAATPEFISPKATVVHTTPLPSAPTTKRENAGSKFWSVLSSPGGISVDAQVKRANELIQRQKLKKEKSRLRRLSLDDFGGESNRSSTLVRKEGDEMTSTPEAMERTPSQSSRNVFAALSRRFTKLSTGASAGTETKEPHSERAGRKGGDRHFQSTKELVEDGRQTHAPSLEDPDGTGLHEESHFGLPNDEAFIESEARTSSPTRWSPTKAAKWMTRKGQEIATNATGRSNEQRRILLDDNEED